MKYAKPATSDYAKPRQAKNRRQKKQGFFPAANALFEHIVWVRPPHWRKPEACKEILHNNHTGEITGYGYTGYSDNIPTVHELLGIADASQPLTPAQQSEAIELVKSEINAMFLAYVTRIHKQFDKDGVFRLDIHEIKATGTMRVRGDLVCSLTPTTYTLSPAYDADSVWYIRNALRDFYTALSGQSKTLAELLSPSTPQSRFEKVIEAAFSGNAQQILLLKQACKVQQEENKLFVFVSEITHQTLEASDRFAACFLAEFGGTQLLYRLQKTAGQDAAKRDIGSIQNQIGRKI